MEADLDYNLPDGVDITIEASDSDGETAQVVFALVITPVNDAPIVENPINDVVVDEDPGLTLVVDLDDVFLDVDGD